MRRRLATALIYVTTCSRVTAQHALVH